MGNAIQALPYVYNVSAAVEQIKSPSVWNRHRHRLDAYGSPHSPVSDIWVRFRDIAELGEVGASEFFNGPHQSSWYPVVDDAPALKDLAKSIFTDVGGSTIGGVLVTKIPPGEQVKPHIDTGWHAGEYEKFAIQLSGHEKQAFHFEDESLSSKTGESYTFDNSKLHWVINDSPVDRITLICCIKR